MPIPRKLKLFSQRRRHTIESQSIRYKVKTCAKNGARRTKKNSSVIVSRAKNNNLTYYSLSIRPKKKGSIYIYTKLFALDKVFRRTSGYLGAEIKRKTCIKIELKKKMLELYLACVEQRAFNLAKYSRVKTVSFFMYVKIYRESTFVKEY